MSISTMVTRRRVVAVKTETTEGTAIALAAADAKTITYDPALKYNVPSTKRPSPGSASNFASLPGARSGELTMKTHVHGAGATGYPDWASWLLACGLVNTSGVFTPKTDPASATCLTLGLYRGSASSGRLKSIAGAAGTFTIKGKVGEPAVVEWKFTGKRVAPSSSTAILAPTYSVTLPPVLLGSTITIGGAAYKISEFEFDAGAKVALVEDMTEASGYAYALVTDREPMLKNVKLMATTAKDFYADHIAGTEVAFSAAIGSASNNTVTIAAPKAQLQESPDDDDNNGYLVDALGFQLNKSADAGDDEYSITFS